jgi:death-on-curing protein
MASKQRKEPIWVPALVVMAMQHTQLLEHGGMHGVRDPSALESALARPQNRFAYDKAADLADFAAGYAFGIASSHPFNDGNKRAAYITAAVFLDLNACELAHSNEEIVRTMVDLAKGDLTEAHLAQWFRLGLVPRDPAG